MGEQLACRRLLNGLLIQWETITDWTSGSSILLPVSYSNTSYSICWSIEYYGGGTYWYCKTDSKTTSGFKVEIQGSQAASATAPFSFITIGY